MSLTRSYYFESDIIADPLIDDKCGLSYTTIPYNYNPGNPSIEVSIIPQTYGLSVNMISYGQFELIRPALQTHGTYQIVKNFGTETTVIGTLNLIPRISSYYVSTTGDDCNDGLTWETPFATITKALSVTGAGGNIYISGGTYVITAPLQILNSGITIMGSFNPITHLQDRAGSLTTVETSAVSGLLNYTNSGLLVIDSIVFQKGSGANPISINGNLNAYHCQFNNNSSNSSSANGIINCTGTLRLWKCLVSNNIISSPDSRSAAIKSSVVQILNCAFYNNVCTTSGYSGVYAESQDNLIINSTFANGNKGAIAVGSGTIIMNCCFNVTGASVYFIESGNYSIYNSILWGSSSLEVTTISGYTGTLNVGSNIIGKDTTAIDPSITVSDPDNNGKITVPIVQGPVFNPGFLDAVPYYYNGTVYNIVINGNRAIYLPEYPEIDITCKSRFTNDTINMGAYQLHMKYGEDVTA